MNQLEYNQLESKLTKLVDSTQNEELIKTYDQFMSEINKKLINLANKANEFRLLIDQI